MFRFFTTLSLSLFFCFNMLFASNWTGAGLNNDWNTDANWGDPIGVPNSSTAVANFPTGNINPVEISAGVELKDLTLGDNEELVITTANDSGLTFSNADSNIEPTVGGGDFAFVDLAAPLVLGAGATLNLNNAVVLLRGALSGPANAVLNIAPNLNEIGVLAFTDLAAHPFEGTINIGKDSKIEEAQLLIAGNPNIAATVNLLGQALLFGSGTFQKHISNEEQGILALLAIGNDFDLDNNTIGTIEGLSYTQGALATLGIGITPLASSQLNLTGNLSLNGTISLNAFDGAYPAETRYTIITSDNRAGTFTNLSEDDPVDYRLVYEGNNVILVVTNPFLKTPVAASALQGNTKSIFEYMFSDAAFATSSPDLTIASNAILTLSAEEFTNNLIRYTPLAYSAHNQTSFQNNLQMAVVLDKQFQDEVKKSNKRTRQKRKNSRKRKEALEDTLCYGIPKTGFFVEPIGVFYNQRATEGNLTNAGQVAFNSYTYGAGMGWDQVLDDQFVIEAGAGYTHSNLHWEQDFGNSRWSSVYLAPFFGWFNNNYYANFMVMGAINIFDTERKILFTGFERIAKSNYLSWDLLLRGNCGVRINLGANFWLQPDATLNFLNIFTESYREKGAGSINLEVRRNKSYILQRSCRLKLIREFNTDKFCYAPNFYLGWLTNNILDQGISRARFADAPSQTFFNMQGYNGTTNQLILGCEFFAQKSNQFETSAVFEADILNRFEVYTVKLKFEWLF